MNIDDTFKLFDIRGPYPEAVDEHLAFAVGQALYELKKPKKVCIAIDFRASSPTLKKFLIDSLCANEVTVWDLGICPMPQFNFSVDTTSADLGVMITASHSPETENGFKFTGHDGLPFSQRDISDLKAKVQKAKDKQIVVPEGHAEQINTDEKYKNTLINLVDNLSSSLKVCVDYNSSSVKNIAQQTFAALGLSPIEVINTRPGNPLFDETRVSLSEKVRETKSDFGIIWDSDADRVVFVDRVGDLISMSFALGVIAADRLKNGLVKKVVVDVRAGLVVRDLVSEAGGTLDVLPAWSQYIKFAMKEDHNICFGGETSGHFVFSDLDLIDDGLLAALRFWQLFGQPGFEEKLNRLKKKYFELPEINFPCPFSKSTLVLDSLANYYRDSENLVSVKDGLTVFGMNWKINLRPSATEPLLRLNLETRSAVDAQKILDELDDHLKI